MEGVVVVVVVVVVRVVLVVLVCGCGGDVACKCRALVEMGRRGRTVLQDVRCGGMALGSENKTNWPGA